MIVRMWHRCVPTGKADAYRAFAGADLEKAKYYPEDADFLLEYEPCVVHYEVVGRS